MGHARPLVTTGVVVVFLLVTVGVASVEAGVVEQSQQPETEIETATTTATGDANATAERDTDELVDDEIDAEFDPATVLERVERLRELNATDEIAVRELDDDDARIPENPNAAFGIQTPGAKLLGLYTDEAETGGMPAGMATDHSGQVVVYVQPAEFFDERDSLSRETVLAHEFAHALQFQHGLIGTPGMTTDEELARQAVVEGDAMVVTEQYHERYVDERHESVAAFGEPLSRELWTLSLMRAPYYHGYQYFRSLNASPEDRDTILDDPPRTTSEVLHPDDPAPEPVHDDRISRENDQLDGPAGKDLVVSSEDRVGELAIRHALLLQNRSEAHAAATAEGWADDLMTYYFDRDGLVHWAIEWESEADAAAFAAEWRRLLVERNGTAANGTIAVPAENGPTVQYEIDREDELVRVVSSTNATETRALADEARAAAPAAESNDTDSTRPAVVAGSR